MKVQPPSPKLAAEYKELGKKLTGRVDGEGRRRRQGRGRRLQQELRRPPSCRSCASKTLYEVGRAGSWAASSWSLLLVFVLYSVGPGVGLWLEQTFGPAQPDQLRRPLGRRVRGLLHARLGLPGLRLDLRPRRAHPRHPVPAAPAAAPPRRLAEIWCLGARRPAQRLSRLVLGQDLPGQSCEIDDLSTGLIAIPLWIPQVGLAVGGVRPLHRRRRAAGRGRLAAAR